jgi:hypothetical protein
MVADVTLPLEAASAAVATHSTNLVDLLHRDTIP